MREDGGARRRREAPSRRRRPAEIARREPRRRWTPASRVVGVAPRWGLGTQLTAKEVQNYSINFSNA